MPMPSPLRVFLHLLFAVLVSLALYICVQAAFILYDAYRFIDWLGHFGE